MKLETIKQGYLKNRLIYNCVLLLCLFFVNCFWANAIYVVYPVLLLLVLVDGLQNGFSYIIFTIPYCLLKPHMSVFLFFICIVAYIIKLCIVSFGKDRLRLSKSLLIVMAVFAVYCLIPFGHYNLNVLIKVCLILFVFASILFIGKKSEIFRIEFNVYLLAISLLISCLFAFTYHISPYASELLSKGYLGEGTRYTALFDNPNVLAMTCEFLLPLLCYFVMSRKSKLYELFLIALVAVIGCLTLSKTFYIILSIVLISLFIWKIKTSPKKTLIISGVVLLGVGLFALLSTKSFIHVWDRFFGYFSSCKSFKDFMNMVTTYRYDLWVEYITYMFKSHPWRLFFGYGLGADAISTFSAHNAYLSMFYQLGLIGSALFVAVIVLICKELKRTGNFKLHKAVWLPILVVMMVFLVEDTLFYIVF